MRSLDGAILFVAVHGLGREKLYLSTRPQIRILFSHSSCGNRFLFLAATQILIRWVRWLNCTQGVTLPTY